jgi:hypothetical protein
MDGGPAPQGLQDSAPGFKGVSTLGTLKIKGFALKLKGREMRVPDEARTYCRAKVRVQLGRATIGPSDPASALLGRSIWRPLQGASLLVDDSQG